MAEVKKNFTLIVFGGYMPIYDIEPYNEAQKIFKGRILENPAQESKNQVKIIYFSRDYKPEANELDQIFVEVKIDDIELVGVPFSLVPKEKLLFGYDTWSSDILIPKMSDLKRFGPRN